MKTVDFPKVISLSQGAWLSRELTHFRASFLHHLSRATTDGTGTIIQAFKHRTSSTGPPAASCPTLRITRPDTERSSST